MLLNFVDLILPIDRPRSTSRSEEGSPSSDIKISIAFLRVACELCVERKENGNEWRHEGTQEVRPYAETVDHQLTAEDLHAPSFFIFILPARLTGLVVCRLFDFFLSQRALSAIFSSRHFSFWRHLPRGNHSAITFLPLIFIIFHFNLVFRLLFVFFVSFFLFYARSLSLGTFVTCCGNLVSPLWK